MMRSFICSAAVLVLLTVAVVINSRFTESVAAAIISECCDVLNEGSPEKPRETLERNLVLLSLSVNRGELERLEKAVCEIEKRYGGDRYDLISAVNEAVLAAETVARSGELSLSGML